MKTAKIGYSCEMRIWNLIILKEKNSSKRTTFSHANFNAIQQKEFNVFGKTKKTIGKKMKGMK